MIRLAIADDLTAISVSELDLGRYVAVAPAETVGKTVETMRNTGYSSVCVVDDGELLGVFTQRDVLMRVLGRSRICDLPIAEEMTPSPRTMQADQSVAEGLAIMRDWWVRSIPVMGRDGGLIGSLSWYTVMRTIAGMVEGPADGAEPEPAVEHGLAFVDFTGLNVSTPVLVTESDSADTAVHHMKARAIGSVLVVDGRGHIVGIVTEFDVLTRLACIHEDLSTVAVRDIMTPDPVTLSARSPIVEAIKQMAERGFSHAPLIGETGRPVGVTSFRDIAEYFEASLESLG